MAIQRLRAAGTTIVLITHKINILSLVDRIMIMGDGMVQAFGSRDEVLRRLTGPKVVKAESGPSPSPSPGAGIGENRVSTL
jgi:ATP-binding cassette subfamily C protein